MHSQELRKILIRKVGNRVSLFLGGDRELVMFVGFLCSNMVFLPYWHFYMVCMLIPFKKSSKSRSFVKASLFKELTLSNVLRCTKHTI